MPQYQRATINSADDVRAVAMGAAIHDRLGTRKNHLSGGMMDTVTLWACSDCTMALVNADTSGISTPERLSEVLSGVACFQVGELTPGLMYAEHNAPQCVADYMEGIPGTEECDCETITFSWSLCDVCLSTPVAGSRHAFTLWPIEE